MLSVVMLSVVFHLLLCRMPYVIMRSVVMLSVVEQGAYPRVDGKVIHSDRLQPYSLTFD
jgi:hypothetical protein